MFSSTQAGKQLLAQLESSIINFYSNVDQIQLHITIAGILSVYDIRSAMLPGAYPDISEKMDMFFSAKRLEGLSKLTLDAYALELRIFSPNVPKTIDQITTADIRDYLGHFENLKLSSVSKKLSVLKSFFGWLVGEEIIQRDPARRIKLPKKEQRLPKALTIEELEMIREACITYRERALVGGPLCNWRTALGDTSIKQKI